MQNLNWDDLRLLLAVAHHASLLDAGRALGIATTTLSRRLAALEAGLGVQLVHRNHAGTTLTGNGARLVQALEPLGLALEATLRDAAGADSRASGSIRLTLAEGLEPLAVQAIASFRAQNPGVDFALDTSFRALDIGKDEADIALRTLPPRSEGLVARRVGYLHFGVYTARQGMAVAMPSPGQARMLLARGTGVVLGGEQQGLKESRWLQSQVRAVSLRTQTLAALVDAVRQGLGAGVIPDELAGNDPSLARIGTCEAVPRKTLWLVMSQRSAKLARVRGFADHVTACLRQALQPAS